MGWEDLKQSQVKPHNHSNHHHQYQYHYQHAIQTPQATITLTPPPTQPAQPRQVCPSCSQLYLGCSCSPAISGLFLLPSYIWDVPVASCSWVVPVSSYIWNVPAPQLYLGCSCSPVVSAPAGPARSPPWAQLDTGWRRTGGATNSLDWTGHCTSLHLPAQLWTSLDTS